MDDDNNDNSNYGGQSSIGLEFLLKLRNSIKKNVKTNVKYLPLDERIPYSVIDMKSEELTPCVRTENVSTKVLCKQRTAFPYV